MKDFFAQEILPRIFLIQQNTKFIYTYKILHYNSECSLIQNTFSFPERGRYLSTPEGKLYITGGYYPVLKLFSQNTFILDENRSIMVALKSMNQPRADHAILYFKGNIYVFGGMSYKDAKNSKEIQSLNTCEVYNVAEDKWTMMPSFTKARQSFGICTFNDKYIFTFGGKCLKNNSTIDC